MIQSLYYKILPHKETRSKIDEIIIRDRKVINRVLGILQWEENQIYEQTKSGRYRTTRNQLQHYMLRTSSHRTVKYDLKSEFPHISHNELAECIDQADEMYRSYLELRRTGKNSGHPRLKSLKSRRMGRRRFGAHQQTFEMSTMYSCKTNLPIARGEVPRARHDKIRFAYQPYRRGEEFLEEGDVRTMMIANHRSSTWFDTFGFE